MEERRWCSDEMRVLKLCTKVPSGKACISRSSLVRNPLAVNPIRRVIVDNRSSSNGLSQIHSVLRFRFCFRFCLCSGFR